MTKEEDKDDDDEGNMLNDLDKSELDFNEGGDDEEEKEEDKHFGMGKEGQLTERSTNIYNLAKSRTLQEQNMKDYLFNSKMWEEELP